MGSGGMVAAAEALAASGRSAEKLSLSSLQSKMKCDPEGYESELLLIYNQFNSSLELFQRQAAMNFTSVTGIGSDPTIAKDLGDRAMFLSHVTPFYPKHLADFPRKLADLLRCAARTLPSGLRCQLTHALILLSNRKVVDVGETLSLFMELQTLGDRTVKKLAFDHVVHSIRRMNQKHKNEAKNRALQNILFALVQKEEEESAKRALVTLCELHRRKVWFDERTANAICTASFHPSSRIMIAALSFLLDYEKIQDDDDSDDSGSDDETNESPQVVLSRETLYKASHQGTAASKKKKKAKLQRAIRSMKRQQRMSSERTNNNYYSPLNHLKDAQGFAEKLFSRLKNCNERFEVKMMILKLIARTIGLHRLFLLDFYPFLQKYIQPHQRDITNLLAAVVQACHDMVPPDAVEPLFKQIVNQFVHDRSRPEAITVGLNAVREICMRMPLLMNEDLLQDLALYKKSREKAVSVAARSLIGLFRELCPSLLVKKDRGRPIDPKARPKAYGEVTVATDVSGVELLQTVDNDEQDGDHSDDSACSVSDNDQQNDMMSINDDDDDDDDDEESQLCSDDDTESDDDEARGTDAISEDEDESSDFEAGDSDTAEDVDDKGDDNDEEDDVSDHEEDGEQAYLSDGSNVETKSKLKVSAKKRKFTDFDGQIIAADTSLRALKKLAGAKVGDVLPESQDGILSNEDFQRIKKLKAKREAKDALAQQGLAKSSGIKVPSSDQLSLKRVDGAMLEVHVRKKMSKDERLALVRAGREERGKYHARTAVKQNKTGGLSNRQKEHKKKMPLAAKRDKVSRTRIEKKKKNQRSGKQFRGRKAWKQ
ncbi:protein SDA1 homolog [Vigna unguiculata]|uniref:Protein SDA1 n=1 Tax=Vigna unguiculata TaxID=3917 RepID=A0A4D6NKI2_VIGUN|nr:protein SDA1 homolog [Vigna unguiculata]QCE13878.1 protein SDA1 [Vigna unguiculata]